MESIGSTSQDLERAIKKILDEFDDSDREGLLDTPKRVAKFYRQFLTPTEFNFTTFDSEGYDEMVVVKNIPFFSLCEHHLAPFFGTASVGYIPNKKIVGLSKIPRAVDHFSRRFQNQERITTQIAELIQQQLEPKGVAVILTARHLCVEMRGVQKHDVWTTTSKMTGSFKSEPITRNEFLNLIK